MAPERPAGKAFLMDSSADIRHRPVVLDTGELRPVVRRRGRTVRRALIRTWTWWSQGGDRGRMPERYGRGPGEPAAEEPAPLWHPA
jgi:hypothetical protein